MKRQDLESFIFGTDDSRRYPQDSPILPDVWLRYGETPDEHQDLLLTPFWGASSGQLALYLRRAIRRDRKQNRDLSHRLRGAEVAYTNSAASAPT